MEYNQEEYVSPHWAGFRKVWWIVAILLFLILLVSWLMGYGPGGKACQVPPQVEVKTVEKLVTKPDVTAPLISLNDNSVLHLLKGDAYVEPGARATDGVDGNLAVVSTGDVDTNQAGEYTVTYKVTDSAGNTTTETRTVIVSEPTDNSAPEISIHGEPTVYLKTGDVYSDSGAKATDLVDGILTVETQGEVDTNKAGEYAITYLATDSAGNKTTAVRKVIVVDPDSTAPIISLNGGPELSLKTGEAYVEQGAQAVDAKDGELKVTIEGAVDTERAGEYVVTYTVTDSAGNKASKTRTVIVSQSDINAPRITLKGSNVLYLERGDKYIEEGAVAMDDVDGQVNVKLSGIVNTVKVGSYMLSYSAVDKAGNDATITRKVIVSPAVMKSSVTPEVTEEEPTLETPKKESELDLSYVPTAKLYFGVDKDDEPKIAGNGFNRVEAFLKDNPEAKAYVSGFHDETGHPLYNIDLANRRARTVVKMLKAAGIPAERIVTQKPIQTTGTGTAVEARRVEVYIGK